MKSNGAAEDSGTKAGETKSSDGEDPEISSGVGGADQSVGYIVHFANAVELYQRKNLNCFACGSSDHLVKDLSKTTHKASLNMKREMMKKGGQTPQKPVVTKLSSPDEAPRA